jgi:hypothetical protein
MAKDFRGSLARGLSVLAAIALVLTMPGAARAGASSEATGLHQPAPHAGTHGFLTAGTMNSFFCGVGSQAIFSNISNQLNILTTVPTDGSCGIAGVQWVGLNGMPLKQISFDVFGGGCTDDEVFGVFMFLVEPQGTVATACQSFVQIPLTNGFTRYVIQPSSPAKINSIVIAHVGFTGGNANHVIGNFLLNGNLTPFIQLNNVHPCPPQIGCPN